MTAKINLHATAILLGTRGVLFVGPSGSGKSMMAFTCLAAARRMREAAFLVADDQVFLERRGADIIAITPPAISGLMELRGSGIVSMESVSEARLHLAIRVVALDQDDRMPPENEPLIIPGIGDLPMIRMWSGMTDPLAAISVLYPPFRDEAPFRL